MKKSLSFLLFILFVSNTLLAKNSLTSLPCSPLLTSAAIDSASLLALEKEPELTKGKALFPITANLYHKILTIIGYSEENHNLFYTDQIAPFITATQDEEGGYHYSIVPGKEKVLLGYVPCLKEEEWNDLPCKKRESKELLPSSSDVPLENHVLVYLNTTNTPLQHHPSQAGYQSFQWCDEEENPYYFYQSLTDPNNEKEDYFGKELWTCIQDDQEPFLVSQLTKNDQSHITIENTSDLLEPPPSLINNKPYLTKETIAICSIGAATGVITGIATTLVTGNPIAGLVAGTVSARVGTKAASYYFPSS